MQVLGRIVKKQNLISHVLTAQNSDGLSNNNARTMSGKSLNNSSRSNDEYTEQKKACCYRIGWIYL